MRPVTVNPTNIPAAIEELQRASHENDVTEIANNLAITGAYTATRTLNAATATLADLRAFVATFVSDLQKGGANRTT
jgi:hypothetical protein